MGVKKKGGATLARMLISERKEEEEWEEMTISGKRRWKKGQHSTQRRWSVSLGVLQRASLPDRGCFVEFAAALRAFPVTNAHMVF